MSRDKRRRRRLSQQDLRALGVQGGLVVRRYPADQERAQVRRLTAEASGKGAPPPPRLPAPNPRGVVSK